MSEMILSAGNTNIRAGVFEDGVLRTSFIVNEMKDLPACRHAYIMSVNSNKLAIAEEMLLNRGIEFSILKKDREIFLSDYNTDEMGIDRYMCVFNAVREGIYPHLIIDTGTADTFDVIDISGKHKGGYITAGLSTMYRALNEFTDALPLREPAFDIENTAVCTDEAVSEGVFMQWLFSVLGFIDMSRKTMDNLKITICGGNAFRLNDFCRDCRIDADYAIKGAYRYAKEIHMQN